jgi:hypothetical protein
MAKPLPKPLRELEGQHIEVPEALSRGTTPGRLRRKDCYRQAALYLINHTELPGLRLVHGTLHGIVHGIPINHAWVEVPLGDDRVVVFDGVRQRFYDTIPYGNLLGAVPEMTYDMPTLVSQVLEHKHYGPWHPTYTDLLFQRLLKERPA